MVVVSEALSYPLSFAFVGYHPELLEMTVQGFRLFALGYLFCGINIYASSFFTALCNGVVSALLSFLRSLLLRGGMVLLCRAALDCPMADGSGTLRQHLQARGVLQEESDFIEFQ